MALHPLHRQEYIIDEVRQYRTLNQYSACTRVRVKLILAYGYVTLHLEFQHGILQVRYSLSPPLLLLVLYMSHYAGVLPDRVRRLHTFLDNTCSTNKNSWACETVHQGKLDFIWISILIASHTKFSPD